MTQLLEGFPIQDSGENIDILGEFCDVALRRQPGARFTTSEAGDAIVEIINKDGDLLTIDLISPKTMPLTQETE